MQAIKYMLAHTVDEAVSLLSKDGQGARPIAGGTDVIVQLRAGRRPQVKLLVDVKGIPDVGRLSYNPREGLYIGSAVPCYQIYENKAIAAAYPGLIDSVSLIGSIQIQGRASVGGNLCNAAPSADAIPSLIVLGGVATIAGPKGKREVPVEQFCTGPGQTVLQPGEFLVSIRIPPPPKNSGAAYLRFIPRNEMDIAIVGAGVSVVLDDAKQRITAARVALSAVAPTPLYVEAAGKALVGKAPADDAAIQEAAAIASNASKPISDMRGTIEQRKHLVGVLTKRALHQAISRARGA
ncbi:MAG: xanthine dehydrogenase family protein subunit M [Dehalococcoidia bacterium]|nr:xanthine dehydrogenase family protein subunit M [Dehalococcoidia bacterium]